MRILTIDCFALKGIEGMRRANKEILAHNHEERAAVGRMPSLHGGVQAHGAND